MKAMQDFITSSQRTKCSYNKRRFEKKIKQEKVAPYRVLMLRILDSKYI